MRTTLFKVDNPHFRVTDDVEASYVFPILSRCVDWNKDLTGISGGSASDAWLPLMRVADYLGDNDFLEYAKAQIASKTEEDNLTRMFEPKGIVLGEIAPLYEASLKDGQNKIPVTDIKTKVRARDCLLNERQIVSLARELGFSFVYPQNKAHVKVTSLNELRQIFERTGSGKNFKIDRKEEPIIASSVLACSG